MDNKTNIGTSFTCFSRNKMSCPIHLLHTHGYTCFHLYMKTHNTIMYFKDAQLLHRKHLKPKGLDTVSYAEADSILKWEWNRLNQYSFYREQLLAGIFSGTLLSLW